MKEQQENDHRVVFITGVSRGIGYELFLQSAKQTNVEVIGVSRNADSLSALRKVCQERGYSNYTLYRHDITAEELPQDLLGQLNQLGRVDVLFNNAGALVNKPFMEITQADWMRCYITNVYGPHRLIQLLYPFLVEARQAHIVNIGSMGGVQGASKFPGLSAYTSSKAALIGLSECLAVEFAETRIRVNTVNLGAVQTEMLGEAFPDLKVDHRPEEVATWLLQFAFTGGALINGKSISLSDSTP